MGSPNLESSPSQDGSIPESIATFRGPVAKEMGAIPLPALLPEEILNAMPSIRPPTPPPEDDRSKQKGGKKLRLLEKAEKPPKDLRLGEVTIRVLERSLNGTKTISTPPPKLSKGERNTKEAWIAGERNNNNNRNGLKRVPSRPFSFIRSR
jgi:U3 small nucleolar RNA-associated protein 16